MTIFEKRIWRKQQGITFGRALRKRYQKEAKILRQIGKINLQTDKKVEKLRKELEKIRRR